MKKSLKTPEKQQAERLGQLLKERREKLGLGPTEVINLTGVSRSYLDYLEHGKYEEVGLNKFCRIVDALGLSTDALLRKAGYLPPRRTRTARKKK